MTERGKIRSGSIVLDEPIDLPEGTEVIVHVEPVVHEQASAGNGNEFENLPFFGMGADRNEMTDSVAWCEKSAISGSNASRSSANRFRCSDRRCSRAS